MLHVQSSFNTILSCMPAVSFSYEVEVPCIGAISYAQGAQIVPKILFFFGCACGVCKFPGQGLNLCHSSDLR